MYAVCCAGVDYVDADADQNLLVALCSRVRMHVCLVCPAGDANTPVLGKQIAAFQGHHQRPWTITQREFANNVHQVSSIPQRNGLGCSCCNQLASQSAPKDVAAPDLSRGPSRTGCYEDDSATKSSTRCFALQEAQ